MSHWIAGDHSGVFHLETPRSEFFERRSFETICGIEGKLKRLWPEDMLFEVQLCKECLKIAGRVPNETMASDSGEVIEPASPLKSIVKGGASVIMLFVAYWIARWLT
jgi:hypothetical protein